MLLNIELNTYECRHFFCEVNALVSLLSSRLSEINANEESGIKYQRAKEDVSPAFWALTVFTEAVVVTRHGWILVMLHLIFIQGSFRSHFGSSEPPLWAFVVAISCIASGFGCLHKSGARLNGFPSGTTLSREFHSNSRWMLSHGQTSAGRPVDLRRMAFELSNGQLRQGLRHLDEDLISALDEPRPNWDVELRVRDDSNGYGLFSGILGEPPSRTWSIRLSFKELRRFTNAISGPLSMQVPCRNTMCSLEQVAGSLFGNTNRATTALRLAAPRAFWLWYTRHTDYGAGIFG